MTIRTFVTPKAGSGFLNIRSEMRLDAANIVGALNEGVRLDFVGELSGWYACRVFISTLVANANDGRFVRLNPGGDFANIRSAPSVDGNTDVGDLRANQQLELLERLGDWLTAKVYVSAAWSNLITEGQPEPVVPVADGFDVPMGTPEDRASDKVWPGAWIDATPYGTRYDATGKWAIHTGADLESARRRRRAFAVLCARRRRGARRRSLSRVGQRHHDRAQVGRRHACMVTRRPPRRYSRAAQSDRDARTNHRARRQCLWHLRLSSALRSGAARSGRIPVRLARRRSAARAARLL